MVVICMICNNRITYIVLQDNIFDTAEIGKITQGKGLGVANNDR